MKSGSTFNYTPSRRNGMASPFSPNSSPYTPYTPATPRRTPGLLSTSDADLSTSIKAELSTKGASKFFRDKIIALDKLSEFSVKQVSRILRQQGAHVVSELTGKSVDYLITSRSLQKAQYDEIRRIGALKSSESSGIGKEDRSSRKSMSKRTQLIMKKVHSKLMPGGPSTSSPSCRSGNILIQAKSMNIKILKFKDIFPYLDSSCKENISLINVPTQEPVNELASGKRKKPFPDFELCDSEKRHKPIARHFVPKEKTSLSKNPPNISGSVIPSIFRFHSTDQNKKSHKMVSEKAEKKKPNKSDLKGYCEPCKKHFAKMKEHIVEKKHLLNMEKQARPCRTSKRSAWDYMISMFRNAEKESAGFTTSSSNLLIDISHSKLPSSHKLAKHILQRKLEERNENGSDSDISSK